MAKKFYLPKSDEGKMTRLINFASKLSNHSATLGISAETVTSVQNDSNMFSYMINSSKSGLKEKVIYKDLLKNNPGESQIEPLSVFNPAAPPVAVPTGIFNRITRLVQNIKHNNNYSESIGKDLGIIGPETDTDSRETKPELKIKMNAGKQVIKWKKGNADSIDIYVDRGDGSSFVFLANDSIPDYTENTMLEEGSDMSVWKYKAIYRIKDEQVGQFSNVTSVMVKKEI